MEKRLNNSHYVVFGLVLLVLVMGVISVVRSEVVLQNNFVGHELSGIVSKPFNYNTEGVPFVGVDSKQNFYLAQNGDLRYTEASNGVVDISDYSLMSKDLAVLGTATASRIFPQLTAFENGKRFVDLMTTANYVTQDGRNSLSAEIRVPFAKRADVATKATKADVLNLGENCILNSVNSCGGEYPAMQGEVMTNTVGWGHILICCKS